MKLTAEQIITYTNLDLTSLTNNLNNILKLYNKDYSLNFSWSLECELLKALNEQSYDILERTQLIRAYKSIVNLTIPSMSKNQIKFLYSLIAWAICGDHASIMRLYKYYKEDLFDFEKHKAVLQAGFLTLDICEFEERFKRYENKEVEAYYAFYNYSFGFYIKTNMPKHILKRRAKAARATCINKASIIKRQRYAFESNYLKAIEHKIKNFHLDPARATAARGLMVGAFDFYNEKKDDREFRKVLGEALYFKINRAANEFIDEFFNLYCRVNALSENKQCVELSATLKILELLEANLLLKAMSSNELSTEEIIYAIKYDKSIKNLLQAICLLEKNPLTLSERLLNTLELKVTGNSFKLLTQADKLKQFELSSTNSYYNNTKATSA